MNKEICPVCENKKNLLSMDMSPDLIMEMAEKEEIADFCGDEILQKRLSICSQCSNLMGEMTCSICGCFVQFRARHLTAHCAEEKW